MKPSLTIATLAVILLTTTACCSSDDASGGGGGMPKTTATLMESRSFLSPPPPYITGSVAVADKFETDFRWAAMAPDAAASKVDVEVQNVDPLLRFTGNALVFVEGEAGRVDGTPVNTYTPGRGTSNTYAHRQISPSQHMVIHYSGGGPVTVQAGTATTNLPANMQLTVTESGGVWTIGAPQPIDTMSETFTLVQQLRALSGL